VGTDSLRRFAYFQGEFQTHLSVQLRFCSCFDFDLLRTKTDKRTGTRGHMLRLTCIPLVHDRLRCRRGGLCNSRRCVGIVRVRSAGSPGYSARSLDKDLMIFLRDTVTRSVSHLKNEMYMLRNVSFTMSISGGFAFVSMVRRPGPQGKKLVFFIHEINLMPGFAVGVAVGGC